MGHLSAVLLVTRAIVQQQPEPPNENISNTSGLHLQLCQSPVNVSIPPCVQINKYTNVSQVFNFVLGLVVMIGFQFIQKRVKKCPNCLSGRPGLLIPVDLIRHSKYRLIYVAIFGSMSFLFYSVLNISQPIQLSNPYAERILSIVIILILVSIICIYYYPLFACVDTPIPIIGHSVGLIFSILYLINTLLKEYGQYTGCANGCKRGKVEFAINVLSSAPILLLQAFLVLWFLWSIIRDIYIMIMPRNRLSPEYVYLQEHIKRVKHRLVIKKENKSKLKTGFAKVLHFIYPYDPGFKFPLRFLAGITVAVCIVYQLALSVIYNVIVFTVALAQFRKQLLLFVEEILLEVEDPEIDQSRHLILEVVKVIGDTAVILGVFLTAAVIVATVFCFVQLFLTFRNVSNHLHLSTKGDMSFLPKKFPTLQRSLINSFKYPGYLIAYSVWAWIVYTVLLMLIMVVLVIGGLFVVYVHSVRSFLGPKVAVIVIGIAWTQLIYWSQFFFTKYVFLEKAYPDSEHLVFTNRRLMHCFTYFFLFQNAFVGIISTFIRIIMSLLFGLLTFSRLDKVLLIRGLESFDAAYRTYVGMLYLDYTQNNSVMNVFCHILLKEMKLKRQLSGEEIANEQSSCNCSNEMPLLSTQAEMNSAATNHKYIKYDKLTEVNELQDQPVRPLVSQRAYNRWRVAYTLIRNESLIELKASSIQQKKESSLRKRLSNSITVNVALPE